MPAKHTPEGDDSFRNSLLRSGAGAVGLIALVAVVFGLIGGLGPDAEGPLVADDPATQEGDPGDDEEVEQQTPDPEASDGDDEPDGTAEGDGSDRDGPAEEPDETEEEPTAGDADEEAEPEPVEEETEEQAAEEADDPQAGAAEREFPPDSVTIQVLDGYQADGGAAASSVAASLRDQGYRVVAENPSLRYEVTTVLFTPGFEPQARQVAADLGAAEVREQPGNLSDQVQVHVVVGADRA